MVSSAVWSIGLVPATTTASLRTPRLNTIVANLAVSPMHLEVDAEEWNYYCSAILHFFGRRELLRLLQVPRTPAWAPL